MKNYTRKIFSLLAIVSLPFFSGCDSDDSGGGGSPVVPSFLVAVAKTGSGQGRVTSTPVGIDCGFDCAQNYSANTNLTLVAQPDPGNSFAGWSGVTVPACGTGTNCFLSVTEDVNPVATFVANTGTGTLGEVVAVNAANELISFRRDTPNSIQTRAAVTLNTAAQAEQLVGVDYRPGDTGTAQNPKIYGLIRGTTTSRVVAINPITGVITASITLVADSSDLTAPYVNLTGTNFGIDFNPVADRLRIVSDTGENLRVRLFDNTATPANEAGFTTTDTPLSGEAIGATGAAYTSNFVGAPGTVLMLIADDKLLIQNPPNDGTTTLVAALNGGVSDIGAIAGFDITGDGDFNTLGYLAATDTNGAGTTKFYEVNLFNGATTFKGAIGVGNEVIRGLALAPAQPQLSLGDVFALTNDNRLLSFNRAAPVSEPLMFRTGVNILGLRAGEDVIGIDHRPVDGALYVVGNLAGAGRLYTLNPLSGLATFVANLAADPADITAPTYSALSGATFGVSFKPTNDRIRIVSSTAQNLTVKVVSGSEGLVTQDTNLSDDDSPQAPQARITQPATASAFSDSLAGVGSSTHYVIDTASDALKIVTEAAGIDSANDPAGELGDVGTGVLGGVLGIDAGSINGFDIDPITKIAFAAFRVDSDAAPDGPNSLFTIDLATGAATKVAPMGGGTTDIKGLALAPPFGPIIFGAVTDGGVQKLVKWSPTYPSTFRAFTSVNGSPDRVNISIGGNPIAGQVMALDFQTVLAGPDLLYALVRDGTADKVYIIDEDTGAATLQVTLTASPDDPTNPYVSPLAGALFDIDFSPTVASPAANLRISSDEFLNLRTNVVTGETFTDDEFGQSPPTASSLLISGVAYPAVNVGTTDLRTTLFVIDEHGGDSQGRLGRVVNPSDGTVAFINNSTQLVALTGTSKTIVQNSKGGLDIVGPRNLLPFAAIKVGNAPDAASNQLNTLFRLNLSADGTLSGTSTLIGVIGDGSLDLNGMAIQFEPPGD